MVDNEFPDADVTSYIKLLRQSGITLYGPDINNVFSEVSADDFWNAISAEVDDYDFHAYQPRYLASNILMLGRILSFKVEKRILSKFDGGLWMIKHVPAHLKYIPETAMEIWFGRKEKEHDIPEDDLDELRSYLLAEIHAFKSGGLVFP